MSRVLILGASGMLGHKLCQRLEGHEVGGVLRSPLDEYAHAREILRHVAIFDDVDVTDGCRLEDTIRRFRPDVVVNGIGLVKQLPESRDEYLAVSVNALLPHRLARLCRSMGSRLIHMSTDCVFNGRRGNYLETDECDATDLYGRSKALGETSPAETAAVTLRTSFIGRELGPTKHGLLEWLLSNDGSVIDGYDSVIYTGVTCLEVAKVIQRLIDEAPNLVGVVHLASEPISKFELLDRARQVYGLNVEIRRRKDPVADRSLVMGRLTAATGYRQPAWNDMLEELRRDPTPYDSSEGHEERKDWC